MTGGAWVLVGFGLGLLAAVWVWLIQPDWIYKKASGNETEGWRRYLRGFIVWAFPLAILIAITGAALAASAACD
jgi:hypothetical protein